MVNWVNRGLSGKESTFGDSMRGFGFWWDFKRRKGVYWGFRL